MKFLQTTSAVLGLVSLAATAPTPPGIPNEAAARSRLAALTVAAWGPGTGYDRDLFPHWSTISGACNAREYVLKRDGTNVVTNSACASTSGSWFSPYDGETSTAASDVDVDHMVPLKNAWISGASSWTTAKRGQFANDITRPQLWAVTDDINQEKSDSSPDKWKPPVAGFHCTYAKSWIEVKSYWALTVTSLEKAALTTMLNTC